MLDLEDYFDISACCRQVGLTCLSVINGTRIRTPAMAEAHDPRGTARNFGVAE